MFMPPIKETEQNDTSTRKGNAYIISIHITYTYIYMNILCRYLRMYVYICVLCKYICLHTSKCLCMYVCMYVYICVYVNTYACIHACIYIYIPIIGNKIKSHII